VTEPTANQARRRAFSIFFSLLALAAVGWGVYWFLVLRQLESTDDAYVAGDVVALTSEVAGTVKAVAPHETERVRKGDVLVELDAADATLALDAARAELARTVREVASLYASRERAVAGVRQREVEQARARADLARRVHLDGEGVVSAEEVHHAEDMVASVEASLAAARAELTTLDAQTRGATVATHPRVQAAKVAVRAAVLNLARTRVLAPEDAVVARRGVQVGQRVAAGAPLMALVDPSQVWVDANFKEVQLGRIRVGQSVTVHADVYGAGVSYHGRVVGLAAGSGSAFALLPAQNASGNWIKIVQRMPVRIALDAKDLAAHPLRVGLSMRVEIDAGQGSGEPLSGGALVSSIVPTSPAANPPVEADIDAIVREASQAPAVRRR
jgi:membrane fusion protein (multidrug efflux system)